MAYIYQITNDVNGKIYIGKTEGSIEQRFKEHCQDSKRPEIQHRPLYAAMQKYGTEHFHIELIEETDNPNECEQYWIEQKGSFKNGYNATLGGDGQRLIDYDLVVRTYKEVQNCNKVAELLHIHKDSVQKILHIRNIDITRGPIVSAIQSSKPVLMIDKTTKEVLNAFSSTADAARYLIDNRLTNCKLKTIRYHISEVCNGKRKTAAGFIWKYQ